MNASGTQCPHCGSGQVASRRQLFHRLMADTPLSGTFGWYSEDTRGACPPKSVFFILLLVAMILVLPAVGLWARELYSALYVLLFAFLALLAGLVFDLSATRHRYRSWGRQWLCADCREVFTPQAPPAGNSALY